MKTNFFLLLSAAAILGACNNNPSGTSANNANDTVTTTVKTDVTQTQTPDTAQAMTSTASVPDSTFLDKAYNIGKFEIKIAKLAQQKSKDAKVKEFATMMIEDHTIMGNEVTALMKKKNYDLPKDLPADLQSKWNDLNKLSGKDFDKKYAEINVDGHKEALDLFKSVSNGSKDPDVKKLATDALPKLQTHEDHATMVQTEVNS